MNLESNVYVPVALNAAIFYFIILSLLALCHVAFLQ